MGRRMAHFEAWFQAHGRNLAPYILVVGLGAAGGAAQTANIHNDSRIRHESDLRLCNAINENRAAIRNYINTQTTPLVVPPGTPDWFQQILVASSMRGEEAKAKANDVFADKDCKSLPK